MKNSEIEKLFFEGVNSFVQGLPEPNRDTDLVKFLGYRHAFLGDLDFKTALDRYIEAFEGVSYIYFQKRLNVDLN
ncbi:MAG: hypothetical protein QNJ54_24305 [Prochloraceae cyanobacterium]|nr:hypothetical protein [Prochloraceae cyanobacterium]